MEFLKEILGEDLYEQVKTKDYIISEHRSKL